jgi:RHS repeat-associated protein
METDSSGTTMASYVLAGLEIVSQYRAGETSYYLHDAQGSVRALTDAAGVVTDRYTYAAFGELVEQQGVTENPYRYTGQQCDEAMGLYSLRARYYDPVAGRFLSRDPLEQWRNVRELNRYSYAANGAVNLVDPSGRLALDYGMQVEEEVKIVGAPVWVVAYPEWVVSSWWMTIPLWAKLLGLLAFITAVTTLVTATVIEPGPEPYPTPHPQPTPQPTQEPTRTPDRCDPVAFYRWWRFTLLPNTTSHKPDQTWYQYEQAVARAGGLYGIYTRTVPTGPIDADGVEPSICWFVEAKYSDPRNPQHREGGPPWIQEDVLEFIKYHNAVVTSNGVAGAQPQGLIVRTNLGTSRGLFERLLSQSGFTLGVNARVEVVPWP